jgi:hypothetical protein
MYPRLAGYVAETPVTAPVHLFTGDAEVLGDSAPALANIAQYQVCVLLATGVTPYVPATHTTAAPNKLVIAQVAVVSGARAPYWTHGDFNHNLLGWPASLSTLALRKEAVLGSGIRVGHEKPPSE